jgi:hypothetical protein
MQSPKGASCLTEKWCESDADDSLIIRSKLNAGDAMTYD